jgi:CBS domain-containing protein
MILGDLVSGIPFVCGPDANLREVANGLTERGHGSAGVVEGRDLIGVVTERDIIRAVSAGADLDSEPVRSWMGAEPDTFDFELDVFDAAEWLLVSGYRHLPVVDDDDELLGIVSIRDLLGAVLAAIDEEE